jgi:UDPglucose--hexose-1-phosphate uridylyltransferase
MSELRHDPIQKRWVIIAPERSRPPEPFPTHDSAAQAAECPFCPGHESKTPPEIFALRQPDTRPNEPGWRVRVVPNRYPVLRVEGELERRGVGLYDRINGVGAHEVVIDTASHVPDFAGLAVEQIRDVLWVCRERLVDLMRDRRLKYVLIFKNSGLGAGASLAHSHTQVVATPVTPVVLTSELEAGREHFRQKERCLFCDILAAEIDSGERVVASTDRFVALAPYASRFPFEILIAPRRHQASFGETSDEMLEPLARVLEDVLLRLQRGLGDPPYNFVIHTAPNSDPPWKRSSLAWETVEHEYHWHLELMPRLMRNAGFEWGTGFYVNPTPPEVAARFLREIEL